MSYPQRTVEVVDAGLVIDQSATLLWEDIRRAFIYDAGTEAEDLTCAEFHLAEGYSVEINSQMPGWAHAIEHLPARIDNLVDER
ncbi:hypothetical protein ACPROK_17445 [Glutamicibacter soli]|uniref:Uncharacterized protein n=1 Tax=Glutamicibacter soli TaxID=453836 RepID=A0A365Y8N7_9MICC|nr:MULTISPECIES: hypothetical protein [Micrococcaceae]ALD62715.1 hypothetical protein AFL94_00640 [Arthrobacter sp. LS16]ALQ32128.1 hypothetical protein ATC04_17375 [Arthrobacter sp. YC-RL1]KLI90609.1 hypothetical protein AA310_00365 [Arthrobacter sp. YC-RL1]NAZ17436.1 hypothetical protein [Glutamicibacter soli]RBL99044.1 hypothetical protein C1H84_16510 [Glutamicibacter soli]